MGSVEGSVLGGEVIDFSDLTVIEIQNNINGIQRFGICHIADARCTCRQREGYDKEQWRQAKKLLFS